MTVPTHFEPETEKHVIPAMMRGFWGRCPKCGRGRLLSGYMTPIAKCDHCGENLAPYQTADFASYLVMFVIGLLYMPIVLVISVSSRASIWLISVIAALALVSALFLLPRVKGAGIALLWVLDVKANR